MLTATRTQVLDALRDLARDARHVVVLDCGTRSGELRRGRMRPGLGAVGVEPRWWGWAPRAASDDLPTAGAAASVALLALDAAGWEGPVEVVELGEGAAPEPARALVLEALARPGTGLVVVTGAQVPLPDGAAPADPGPPTARTTAERAVLDMLGQDCDPVVEHAVGDYGEQRYEVVRFPAPADAQVATLRG